MKILIASLQVSDSGSKGHLHPAVELALEAKRKGHDVAILPVPSPLGNADAIQLQRAGITYFLPPEMPVEITKSPNELAQLAADPSRVHLAYSSFLLEPIEFQQAGILNILGKFKPDIVLYDLLVYSVPLIARSLGIPDVGFCAGLKLIAPDSLLGIYADVAKKLNPSGNRMIQALNPNAKFHHLELISPNGQIVFAPERLYSNSQKNNFDVFFAGALPISPDRYDLAAGDEFSFNLENGTYAVLSFGSVLDPADFPKITQAIVNATRTLDIKLLIGSRKMSRLADLPSHVKVYDYLPLPKLIGSARVYVHHGGANSFSEGLRLGAKQVIIPLTTDQPIQGHYLNALGAGICIAPVEVTQTSIHRSIERLNDINENFQSAIRTIQSEYQKTSGSSSAVNLLERTILKGHR